MKDTNEFIPSCEYNPQHDYIRVASATPEVTIGDIPLNADRIAELYDEAHSNHVSLVTFPELSLTGYSLGDLVQSQALLDEARSYLDTLARYTIRKQTAAVVGLPIQVGNGLYNAAAMLADGKILGIVPKQHLPTYKEFYEKRWYQTWDSDDTIEITIGAQQVPFGPHQLFNIAGSIVGIEICEDVWVPDSPNVKLTSNGAHIIVNPSASPEIASKSSYRRNLIAITAGKLACAYVYAGADSSESTMDIVMSGHALINESGKILAERQPFSQDKRLTIADVDVSHLRLDRMQNSNYPVLRTITPTPSFVSPEQQDLRRHIDPHPFIPHGATEQVAERLEEVFTIQSVGLAERIKSSGIKKVVLGLSGGLDSTLALLVAERAARRLNIAPRDLIETLTMPSQASSKRTQSNAVDLAQALGIPSTTIPIGELSATQLQALDHSGIEDVTFQNTQARIRTALLFNRANQLNGLVLGTGDLSEIALGWCTFGGDHLSHYNVNASVPKTLVRHLVAHASEQVNDQAKKILLDIIDTPVSPELTGDGTLNQETESLIGPYELHDFFLYQFVRYMDPADKVLYLAEKAFEGIYEKEIIRHHLETFIKRFYTNQWKRSVMPDGPKVGTVSLSPRGDWRMPSDAAMAARRDLIKIGVLQ